MTTNGPHEPSAEARRSSKAMYEMMETFRQAGFSEDQAFGLVAIAWQTACVKEQQA